MRILRLSELLVSFQNAVLGEERPRKTTAPGQGNTVAVKDASSKTTPKNTLTCLLKSYRKTAFFDSLTLLSEITRKVAIFELSKLRNGASATPKQQGPKGRRRRKKGAEKLPNVTSETHRKWGFWGFLSYLSRSKTQFLGEERPHKTTAPGQGNTVAVKDASSKTTPKNTLTCLLKS